MLFAQKSVWISIFCFLQIKFVDGFLDEITELMEAQLLLKLSLRKELTYVDRLHSLDVLVVHLARQ